MQAMETTAVETSTAAAPEGTVQAQEQKPLMPEEKKTTKIMVAIDDSDESYYVLKWALDNLFKSSAAATPEPDMLTIVHVMQPFHHYLFPAGPAVYASTVVDSVKKAQEENAATIRARALQMCLEKTIKAETLILEGDPKEMICQAAEQMHSDLLLVGSRGLGKIKRAFLGSVSDYCAHHAKCPILIVKPPKESHM